jgi:hypothetical protein
MTTDITITLGRKQPSGRTDLPPFPACRSSRREASSTPSMDAPPSARVSLIGTASRLARGSNEIIGVGLAVMADPGKDQLPCSRKLRATAVYSSRIHEEMDWGAIARKRTIAQCPANE